MVEANNALAVDQNDRRSGAGAVEFEVFLADGRRVGEKVGIKSAADLFDVLQFLGSRCVLASRRIPVALRWRDHRQPPRSVVALQLCKNWRFGFAVAAPVRPEEKKNRLSPQR